MEKISASPWLRPTALYAAWFALFMLMFFKAWVSEDAYITFRVIDNALHGYGLRWNVMERVQVYTHPLWLLAQWPLAWVWGNMFYANIALSLVCSSAAVALALLTFRKSLSVMLICFLLPLFLSKVFIEYATSGLETSLAFLLFALVGFVWVKLRNSKFFWFYFSLSVALSLFNRLDTIILFAPLCLALAAEHKYRLPWKQVIPGMLPLLAWFIFSLFYYGFLFPNTKYAKLDTGLPLSSYLMQGVNYLFIWLTHDALSALTSLGALIYAYFAPRRERALALGIALYIAYVIAIGGDYMMGRFFAFPFFASVWLLLACVPKRISFDKLFALSAAMLTSYGASYFIANIREECIECIPIRGKVIDAHKIFKRNALFAAYWPPEIRSEGHYKFAASGKRMALEYPAPIKTLRYVGMSAYYAGPRAVFIDELGLTDPLLSRLPAIEERLFYVGHYKRSIPGGYVEAVRSGDVSQMEPSLARYYEKLKLITQGDLWDKERLSTLIAFNMGQYEHWKNAYLASKP